MNAFNLCVDETETAPPPWSVPHGLRQPSWKTENFVRVAKAANTVSACVALANNHGWLASDSALTLGGMGCLFDHPVELSGDGRLTLGKLTVAAGMDSLLASSRAMIVNDRITAASDARTAIESIYYAAGSFAIGMTVVSARTGGIDLCIVESDPLRGYERYASPNWDGYDADPITSDTLSASRRLLRMLPSTFGPPDIAPGADGTIGLEWIVTGGPLRKLFIDVGPGRVWSGYWRRSSGEKQSLRPSQIDGTTEAALRKLFDRLTA